MILILLSTAGCNYFDVGDYIGDGTVEGTKTGIFKGVTVRLDSFSTSEYFEGSYTIVSLPKSNETYVIGLEILDYEKINLDETMKGYLSIELKTERGDRVIKAQGDLENWTFEEVGFGDYTRNFIYYIKNGRSYFDYGEIKNRRPLNLDVVFRPKDDAKGYSAEIILKTGGTK